MRCDECRWWDRVVFEESDTVLSSGKCHVSAPVFHPRPNYPDEDGATCDGYWPYTEEAAWCGKFQRKDFASIEKLASQHHELTPVETGNEPEVEATSDCDRD